MKRRLTICIAASLLTASALRSAAQDNKQALAEAQEAYVDGIANGNEAVRELIERNPGNIQLAQEGLQIILQKSGHDEEWSRYATSNLLALEELGFLFFEQDVSLEIDRAQLEIDLKEGRRLSAGILLEKIDERYPSWDRLELAKREHREGMPPYRVSPPHTGSPMELFKLCALGDDRWAGIRDANPAAIAETIDKRIEKTIEKAGKSFWEGEGGYLEDWTALDMHLRSQPLDKLAALRAYQERKLRENPDNLTADALSVFRRFPWAETAHRRLFDDADADLTKGRLQAAYRSFDDVRTHSANADLRKRADEGCKLVRSNMEKASTQAESKVPDLASLQIQTVAPPPILPWRIGNRSANEIRPEYPELQVKDDHVVLSGRRYLAVYDSRKTDLPKWIRTCEVDIGSSHTPGSYRPALIDGKVYARNIGKETAVVMNVMDLAGGIDLWTMGRYQSQSIGISTETAPALDDYQQFLSKPVLVDGVLLYLSYEHGPRNPEKYHSVVAVDIETRKVLWRSLIDIESDEMRITPHPYGIPPIVHKGFVYAVSSHETVSCHDLRDGQLVWVHKYSVPEKGWWADWLPRYAASPVIVGKRLICSPLDNVATIALDMDTGRTLWSNPDVCAVEQIGCHGDTVLVRDELTVAALSADDGKIRWAHRCEHSIVGRVQLMGDRVYVATEGEIVALSAKDGTLLEKRLWELKDGPPQAARVDGDGLFVVGSIPYLDPAKKLFNMAAPKAPGFKLPLHLAWELPAERDSTQLMPPPPGSPLAGKTYYLHAGLLTCVEANPQGGIVWQRFVRQRQRVSGTLFTFERGVQPMFFDEVIVLRDGQAFIAFNGRTGERLWSRYVGLARIVGSSGDIIWCSNNETVTCLDSRTGRTLWTQIIKETTNNHETKVFVSGNAMHVLAQRGGNLWHGVVNPRTGQRLKTYKDIRLGSEWHPCRIYNGSQGAMLLFGEKLLSYRLDGKPVEHVRTAKFASVFASNDKYLVVEDPENQVAVYKFGDAGYRATPLSGVKVDRNNWFFELDGERLICVHRERRVVLFDLQAKKVLHDSEARESRRKRSDVEKQMKHISRPRYIMHEGNRLFVQMTTHNIRVDDQWVPAPAPSYFLDLQSGRATDATGSVIFPHGARVPHPASHSITRYSNGLIMHGHWIMHGGGLRYGIQCWSPRR